MSLRDVRFALDGDRANWHFVSAVRSNIWPPVKSRPEGGLSFREVNRRFASAGVALRELANESVNVWQFVDRETVVRELHHRLRDPATMTQNPTDLCGPYSIMFEFARRNPVRYVRGAAELLRSGVFTARSGKKFVAEEDLLRNPNRPAGPAQVDWIYAATMRDSENVSDDVDDGIGLEGATWPFELEEWTEDVLGLKGDYFPCFFEGELSAIRSGQQAVERGGVAFLLIDKNLLHQADNDDEEDMWWQRRRHEEGGTVTNYSALRHSEDDESLASVFWIDPTPSHYAVLLGELSGAHSDASEFRVKLWSYGCEYKIKGKPDSFGEYLYAVITGEP